MNKCAGCGCKTNSDQKLCERCFQIKNYNRHDIKSVDIDNDMLLSKINSKKMLTFFLCDFLSLNKKNIALYNKISNQKVFVVTKMDNIPKNIKLNELEKNIKSVYEIKDILFVSIKNNFGISELKNKIYDNKVLICGPSNSGKSSLINYLFDSDITVSNYKNTTQDFIEINSEYGSIVDVPGFNFEDTYDKIKQNGLIKPRIINLKNGYELIVDNYVFSFDRDVNLTVILPNNILTKTRKIINICENKVSLSGKVDVLVNNLGFIYIKESCIMNCNKVLEVRNSVIGGK